MGKKRPKGKRGRKPGRERNRPVPLPGEAIGRRQRNPGPTPETARRKELLIGSRNPLFSDNAIGVLFVNDAIDQGTFRAACCYAWLHRTLYGGYGGPGLCAVSWDGLRPAGAAKDFSEQAIKGFRYRLLEAERLLQRAGLQKAVDDMVLLDVEPAWLRPSFVTQQHVVEAGRLKAGLELLRQWYDADLKQGRLVELRDATAEERRDERRRSEAAGEASEIIYSPNPVVDADSGEKRAHVRGVLKLAKAEQQQGPDDDA